MLDALQIEEFEEGEFGGGDALGVAVPGSSLSSEVAPGTPSASMPASKPDKTQSEEEAKRMRNRASVEKCRRKKRQRQESLTRERASLTRENTILKDIGDETRTAMIQILHEVALLSGGGLVQGGAAVPLNSVQIPAGDAVAEQVKE